MRKFILASVFIIITCPSWGALKYGSSMECFLNTSGNNQYWYCGGGQTSCAGNKMSKKNLRTYYSNGQAHTFNEKTYVCCGVTSSNYGKFIEINDVDDKKWKNKDDGSTAYYEKTITVNLNGGGKCTYGAQFNGCGEEITTPCTTPTDCTDGLIKRNGVCVKPCPDGSAFESPKSNACIKCDTTEYQGQKKADQKDDSTTSYYCVKCDSETQLWDKEAKECVTKSDPDKVTHITPNAMSKCGLCDNNTVFTDCVKCYSKAVDNTDKDNCKNEYETQCFLQD